MNERKFAVIGHPLGHTMSPISIYKAPSWYLTKIDLNLFFVKLLFKTAFVRFISSCTFCWLEFNLKLYSATVYSSNSFNS